MATPVLTSDPTQPLPSTPAMPDDAGVGTPLWWVYRLEHRLRRRLSLWNTHVMSDGQLVVRESLGKLQRYYDGAFDLPYCPDPDVAREFALFLQRSRSNFMRMIVDYQNERTAINGLRLPGDDEAADTETWNIWLRNEMDYWSPIAFRLALTQRQSFLSTWYADDDQTTARIAVEDPQQCIVEFHPGTRQVAAGLKLWVDDWTGRRWADLFLPTELRFLEWRVPEGGGPLGWYERQPSQSNPLREVPLTPVTNRPDLYSDGYSEIEDGIPIQDRLNQSKYARQSSEHLSAFDQKWAVGLQLPKDPETGDVVQPFKAALETLWTSSSKDTKFGQFDATDLDNYKHPREEDLEELSVTTRTPRHAFVHQGQAPSGDAMKSDEVGFVGKVKASHVPFGWAVKRALRQARTLEGLTTPLTSEVVWADPEYQTITQLGDFAVKMVQAKLASLDWAREKIGMTPATIRRVKGEIERDRFLDDTLTAIEADTTTGQPDDSTVA